MLAVIGTWVSSIGGGFSNPTTPNTLCHHAAGWEAISSEDK
jgi:hypothetical protein